MNITRDETAWANDLFAATARLFSFQARCELGTFIKGARIICIYRIEQPTGFFSSFRSPTEHFVFRVCGDPAIAYKPLFPAVTNYTLEVYDRSYLDDAKKLASYIEQDTERSVTIEMCR